MNYLFNGQFHNFAGFGFRNIRYLNNPSRNMSGRTLAAETRFYFTRSLLVQIETISQLYEQNTVLIVIYILPHRR